MNVSGQKDGKITLSGAIDGTEDFGILLGGLPPGSVLDCEGITQINSTGIKAWMRFFCAPDKKDAGFVFEKFAIPLVEQLNMFMNFLGTGRMVSLAIPFRCKSCDNNFSQIFKVEDAHVFKTGNATVACPRCNGPSQFDDLPDEYFEFLARSP